MSVDLDAQPRGATAGAQEEVPEATKPVLDAILREEAEHANREYARCADDLDIDPVMFRKYATPWDLWDWRQMGAVLMGELRGKDVLDYGCGMGEEAVYFAKLGARVTAIDISEVGIATLRKRARRHGLALRALEMRCDPTSLPPSSFDLVHGMGILHHVGADAALAEVWRLLRPGGTGVFLEPMGDHPVIEAVKAFLMKHGRALWELTPVTDHEHNLTWREIEWGTRRFSHAVWYPYHLLYRLKRFLPSSAAARDAIRRFDHGALWMAPRLRRYAGAVVIKVVK